MADRSSARSTSAAYGLAPSEASSPLRTARSVVGAHTTHQRLEIGCTAAAFALVIWFYGWTVAVNSGFENWGDMDYYRLLVRGWKKGQLHLDKEPSPDLLALKDPYDPEQNTHYKLGDATLYRNRYYIYFGPAPALTLMLPFNLLTGRELTMGAATYVFCSLAFVAASGVWLAIRRRFFPESRWWMAPCGVLAIGFGTHLLALAQRPMIWELPISSGVAFTLLAFCAVYRAVHGTRPRLAMATAGLCLGLAVGSRPTCLFAAGMLLVPPWLAWRAEPSGREWWQLALAALLPLGACGLAIMAHNYARFDNVLEWGQNYQLSGAYEGKLTHFSPRFFPHNFLVYFFHPLSWTSEFPFAWAQPAPDPKIADYFGTEEVSGLFATFPFFWFLLALPLAWWRRAGAEHHALNATFAALGVAVIPVMTLVLSYFSTTMRYEADFAVSLGLLALVGMLAIERWVAPCATDAARLQLRRGPWSRTVAVAATAACGCTVVVGALVSLDYHGRSMRVTSPVRWEALTHAAHRKFAAVGHWLGQIDGPRVLKVRFKSEPTGTRQTFWRPTDPQADERIVVEHIGDHLIRFGYARGGEVEEWGRPLRWKDNHTHTVHVQTPSLYRQSGHGWWTGVRRRHVFRERTSVAVWFSGGRALSRVVEPLPKTITPGGAIGADFSGEVRKIASRLHAADEVPSGLAEPHAARGGVLRMRVVFPEPLVAEGEPLFAAGAHYRSSIVFVQPAKDGLKFVFENYAQPRVESPVFRANPAGHMVEIEMASFRPDAYGIEATGDVVVRLDGHEMVRTTQVAYPFPWGDEQIGRNLFGTTCAAEFTGWILDARWVRK